MQGAEALAEMLKKNKTLRMLDIGCCELRIKGLLGIASAVTNCNATLETLGLEDCQVRPCHCHVRPCNDTRVLTTTHVAGHRAAVTRRCDCHCVPLSLPLVR